MPAARSRLVSSRCERVGVEVGPDHNIPQHRGPVEVVNPIIAAGVEAIRDVRFLQVRSDEPSQCQYLPVSASVRGRAEEVEGSARTPGRFTPHVECETLYQLGTCLSEGKTGSAVVGRFACAYPVRVLSERVVSERVHRFAVVHGAVSLTRRL